MNDTRRAPAGSGALLGWVARLSSLVTNSVFLLILCLAVLNEDKPQGPSVTVLVLLALTMAASFAAWRWERAGGALVAACGFCLGVAACWASLGLGLGASGLLGTLIYGAPFILVGALFWVSGAKLSDDSTG